MTVYESYASSSGAGNYLTGSSVTVNAGSREGYTFLGWIVSEDDVSLSNSTTATFTMPANNIVLTATWTLTSSNGGDSNGSSPSPSASEPEPSIPAPSSSYTSDIQTNYVWAISGIMLLLVVLVIVVLVIVVIVAIVLLSRKGSKT
ncbi:MAG: hypothetical protein LBB87_04985 [Nitrososphaerota archaeon]|nr:hypothetical protein [Nitrososphaerota archaeon]